MILLPKIRLKKKLRSEKEPECYKKKQIDQRRWLVKTVSGGMSPKIMRAYKQTLLLVEMSKEPKSRGGKL